MEQKEDGKSSGDAVTQLDEEAIDKFLHGNGFSAFSAAIARQWLQKVLKDESDKFSHVRAWMINELQDKKPETVGSRWQRGCPEYIPGLKSEAFWDPKEFTWASVLEENWETIRDEVLATKGKGGFQEYRAPTWADGVEAGPSATPKHAVTQEAGDAKQEESGPRVGKLGTDKGNWNVSYLALHNVDCSRVRELCPKTWELLSAVEGFYDHAFFSSMSKVSHITKHTGPTNKKLRCQLPLIVPTDPPSACRLRAGDEVVDLKEGKCIIFDDSYEHEAWNDSEQPRLILIFDVWHPDLTKEEVKFLTFLQNAKLRQAERLSQQGVIPPNADFYEVIKRSRAINVEDELVFPSEFQSKAEQN